MGYIGEGEESARETYSLYIQQVCSLLSKSIFSCDMFGKYLGFPERPLSQEETDFPLAYGMLVYKDYLQVSLLFVKCQIKFRFL